MACFVLFSFKLLLYTLEHLANLTTSDCFSGWGSSCELLVYVAPVHSKGPALLVLEGHPNETFSDESRRGTLGCVPLAMLS